MQLQNLITLIYHDFGERKAQACDNDFGDSDISNPTRIIQRLSIVTVMSAVLLPSAITQNRPIVIT